MASPGSHEVQHLVPCSGGQAHTAHQLLLRTELLTYSPPSHLAFDLLLSSAQHNHEEDQAYVQQ